MEFYGIVYSVLLSVELIGRLGLPQAVSKLVAGHRGSGSGPGIEATGCTLSLIVYAAIFVVFLLSAPGLAAVFNLDNGADLFRIAALDIPFYGVYFMLVAVLSGRRQFTLLGFAGSIYTLVKTVGIIVLVLVGPSVAGALMVNVIGSIVALGLVARWVGPGPFRLTFEEAGPVIQLAIPVAIMAVGTQAVVNVDLWMLNALGTHVDDAIKGMYVAATSVARIPNAVAFVMTSVLVPTVAHALGRDDRALATSTVEKGLRLMAIALVPGCTLIAIEAREILALLFSRTYQAGAPFLVLLAFSHGLCSTVFMTFSNLLVAAGRQRISATVAILMLAVVTTATSLGVIFFGAYGAALGALVANAVAAATMTVIVFRTFRPAFSIAMFLKLLVATAILGFVAALVPTAGVMLIVEFLVLGGMLLALLLLFRLIDPVELEPYLQGPLKRFLYRT